MGILLEYLSVDTFYTIAVPSGTMSESNKRCPSCGEYALIHDEDCRCVCEACGTVIEDTVLVSQPGFGESQKLSSDGHNSLPTKFYIRNTANTNFGKNLALRRAKEIGQALTMTSAMIEEATTMFVSFFETGRLHRSRNQAKIAAAACCLYIICRKDDWPIMRRTVANFAQTPVRDIIFWTRELTVWGQIEISSTDMEELVPIQLSEWGLPPSLHENIINLLDIARKTWISEGRHTTSVVQAAVYITYEFYRFKEGRKRCLTYPVFCQEVKVRDTCCKSMVKTVRIMKNMLRVLATEVPWIIEEVTLRNVAVYLEDILQHKKALMHDALQQGEKDEENGNSDSCDNLDICDASRTEASRENIISKTSSVNEPGNKDTECCERSDVLAKQCKRTQSELSSVCQKKRKVPNIFLPGSFLLNRQKSEENAKNPTRTEEKPFVYPGNLNSLELSENDISDTEIKQYLRNEEQLKIIAHLYE